MPGHKFGQIIKDIPLLELDATEATDLDNLYEATGIIKQAMNAMSTFYQSKHTIFLTNGSTAGIISAILSVCRPKDKIIVARNCHYSVWNALILADVIPIYITPKYFSNNIIGEIDINDIKTALTKYPEIKGAIIVSPTYEGIVSDIKSISDILHEQDKILIVDEAHGAHFVINKIFPQTSILQGADLVVHSMHKNLPALTQSALLHICTPKIKYKDIIKNLKLIQTSSPSYMMMGTMDYLRNYIEENYNIIEENYIKPLIELRSNLTKLKNLQLLDEKINRYDISKIVIFTHKTNISGYKLAQILENEYNLGVELASKTHIILITTMADDREALRVLAQVLIEIDSKLELENTIDVGFKISNKIFEGKSPRKINFASNNWIEIDKVVDKISAQNIMLYPPGIPPNNHRGG